MPLLSIQWWSHFHHQQPLTMQHCHGCSCNAFSYHTPKLLVPLNLLSLTSFKNFFFFLSMWALSSVMTQLKNYIPFRESLLWYTHSGKRSHCHYVTFCLKHVWYAFWILIKFLIYIIHFSLPKAGFLTGLLGKQKYNLRKHHSSLSL